MLEMIAPGAPLEGVVDEPGDIFNRRADLIPAVFLLNQSATTSVR
jgi:hypothetical protein